jgi:sulfide dehydrogenase [flavocytochrome c] flavoprotein subunit
MLRRDFFKLSICAASVLASAKVSAKVLQVTKKTSVAILGGGFGGLSAAKYLKDLDPNLDVTLIEKRANFISCPLSNAWLGELEGFTYESLNFDYNSSISKYRYNFLNETVVDINRQTKEIITDKSILKYDYMIMALGIEYNYKKIFKKDKEKAIQAQILAPAGLKPGSEHLKLKRMISNFKGGNFVISIPKSSYKCPPAPYERACMIANYFKTNNIDGKVIIIDPRVKPASKASQFLEAFNTIYKDYVEYKNLTNFKDVDFDKKIISLKSFDKQLNKVVIQELPYNELSIIPPNRANSLYKKVGIKTYAQGWVKLRKPTFRTVSDDDIYVIGDAQGEYPFPKSGQMANSCALIVAQELVARIKKEKFNYEDNLPGNICYSIVAPNKAMSVSHFYEYTDKLKVTSQTSSINSKKYDEAKLWYKGLTDDIFGL